MFVTCYITFKFGISWKDSSITKPLVDTAYHVLVVQTCEPWPTNSGMALMSLVLSSSHWRQRLTDNVWPPKESLTFQYLRYNSNKACSNRFHWLYPPWNYNISPPKVWFEDDFPFPKVGYVSVCRRVWFWDHILGRPRLIESTLSGLLSDAKEGKNPFEGLTPEAWTPTTVLWWVPVTKLL